MCIGRAPGRRTAAFSSAVVAVALCLLAGCSGGGAETSGSSEPSASGPGSTLGTTAGLATRFNYGFDLAQQAPDTPGTDAGADDAARAVLGQFSGSVMDLSIDGFGLPDPEPSPGHYDLSTMSRRLDLIEAVGGIPVISLVGAPAWMRSGAGGSDGPGGSGGASFFDPPTPEHYQDFAALCAHIASAFHQVRYFVVWNEMKRFFSGNNWDYVQYTDMYNAVYTAIKKVRPDAQVGGPYAVMSSFTTPPRGVVSTLNGGSQWGYLDQGMLDTISYWLSHKVGGDFIAVDGATTIAKDDNPGLADPLTASLKYAAVDQWIRGQTSLPIWWMESHIQPTHGWTDAQAVADRIATLAVMSSSGASVGMQWQPQDDPQWPDEGLWTSTDAPGGGQPTTLSRELQTALPVLRAQLTLAGGQPSGVLVATSGAGTLLVNTLAVPAKTIVGGVAVDLPPGAVIVR